MSGGVAAFSPSGVVTLTTDFGLRDSYVGVMKGVMLCRAPQLRIVDLTHEVLAHWPIEAGFWLAHAYGYFPSGTVHVAVVDPGVGSAREIAVVELDGHVFLAPDNGLLAPVLEGARGPASLRRLASGVTTALGLATPSATFHGRDIFAPIAAELAVGRVPPDALGPLVDELTPAWLESPRESPGQVSGVVVTIDHFGNLLTNIDARLLKSIRHALVHVGGRELTLHRTYADVRPGDYLALVNSFGVLEIACAERSAALGLGIARGAPVLVSDRDHASG